MMQVSFSIFICVAFLDLALAQTGAVLLERQRERGTRGNNGTCGKFSKDHSAFPRFPLFPRVPRSPTPSHSVVPKEPDQAQTNAPTDKQIRAAEIAKIKAYCQELDDYAKRNPKLGRLFADVSSGMKGEKSRWREFKSEGERERADTGNDLANVWAKDGATVSVYFTFQSPSGDWAHYVNYYFRDDGSLAKTRAQLNTFYGNMTVIRERFYDLKGRLLSSSQQFLDLETKKKKKPGVDGEFIDEPIPVYRTVKALPFYTLLSKTAAKTK